VGPHVPPSAVFAPVEFAVIAKLDLLLEAACITIVTHCATAALAGIAREPAAPAVITVDNGSEFYARLTDSWAYHQGVWPEFSPPAKPIDNRFIESFNGRLRDEHLNVELFFSILDAQQKIPEWPTRLR
jgi:transposase InsO family protein